jgi:hypothetical protein
MSRATLARLQRLRAKARLAGSIMNLRDEELFSAFRNPVARGGGVDGFATALHAKVLSQLQNDDEKAAGALWTCSAFVESGLVAIRPAFRTEPD